MTGPTVPPGYKQTEAGVIPEEWEASTVGREFEVQLGKMLDSEKNVGTPKPYLGNRSVQWDQIDVEHLLTMRMTHADLERYRLRLGDLLVCEGGEIGRAAIWDAPIDECYYQKALHRLRAVRGYVPSLMGAYLRSWADQGMLDNYVTQTSIAHLPREKLIEVPLPLPPLAEQRAIAAALGDVDALLAALASLLAKKRDLKQAAMQSLLTGARRLPGFSGDWETQSFGQLFQFLRTANNSRADLSDSEGVGYIHYGDIHTSPLAFLDCSTVWLPAIERQKVVGIARVQDGDLIMADASEDYAGVGKSMEVRNVGSRAVVSGLHTFLLRGNNALIAPGYAGYLQFIPMVKTALERFATGISVYGISKGNVQNVEVRLPPVTEQAAIAAVLSDLDDEIAAVERRVAKTRALKQGMMQELLTGRRRLV